ncbi:hemin uptake protein HemP [Consotaella aegiceratis]|uniref:hemin uptake protein HemP n=1 Tax=Consotaella aegiceratis TaxID=3097961 RepID=UPI002F421AB1
MTKTTTEPGVTSGVEESKRQPRHQDGETLCLDASALFATRREVLIRHDTELYRLRLTANNKLILTK